MRSSGSLWANSGLHSVGRKALATFLLGGVAFFYAQPAEAQNSCTTVGLGVVNCLGGTGTVDPTVVTGPLTVTLADGSQIVDTVTLGTIGSGDIVVNSVGSSLIQTTGPGLVANSAESITANVTAVSTTADGGTGVLLNAVDDVIFTSDGLISTTGDNADGVNIEGGTVTADLNAVRTEGVNSDGVELVSTDGPVSLDADLIEVSGDGSSATIVRGTGDIGVSVRALRTGGTDGVAMDLSTDAAACVLLGAGGCDVTATADEITTEGFGGIGGLVSATGDTDLDIGVLRTGGDEAAGLDLSADPTACVVLGAGACDTAFTVNELTTAGDRSPGAVVRGVGDIDANVGVLRTGGDQAVGLDLASDPTACAILGAGACDTSFSVGQLTTDGAGSTGALIRSSGLTTGNVGVLRTQGDDAAGIDIAADPTACAILGAGACDVGLAADEVSTQGDGAAAVLINAPGNILTQLGLVSTQGDNSTGLGIVTDPAICLALGPGSCRIAAQADTVETGGDNSPGIQVDGGEDPIDVEADNVDTTGDNSPGVDVEGTGIINVDVGTVDTAGNVSPGVVIDGDDDAVTLQFDAISTLGDDSPGAAISAEGPISVTGGTVVTRGARSTALRINGGAGPVAVNVGAVTTTGPASNGIDVATTDGDIGIVAGPVTVTGLGSNGISAVATGCGDVSITARDDIRSSQGVGILASSACSVAITSLPGADVSGAPAGILATSGTGATITLGGDVAATAGPAIDVDGAGAASVTVGPTGSVTGFVDLTDSADVFTNRGLFRARGTSTFGAGADALTNFGTLNADGAVTLGALETFNNNGLVTMVDAAANDTLTLSGNYVGGTGSQLAIDVAAATAGTPADRLIVGGNASGTTAVTLNLLGGPGVVNRTGTVIVDAGTAAAGAFTLAGPTRSGFVDYSIAAAANGDFRLFATPNVLAVEPALLAGIGQTFWYQSADAFTQSAHHRRGNLNSGIWMQAYGGRQEAGKTRSVDVFGTATATDLSYDFDYKGVQAGVDLGGGDTVFGITGGYELADTDFASGAGSELGGYNIGAYMIHAPASGFYAQLLGKADFFDLDLQNGIANGSDINGKSYGVEGEAGYRMLTGGLNVDIGAGLAWVRTEIDSFTAGNATFDFDHSDSLRGRAGIRVGSNAPGFAPYLEASVLHEFKGDNESAFLSGGEILALRDYGRGTWGRAEVGLAGNSGAAGGYIAAWGEFGDVKGYGLRAGIRF